MSARPPGIPPQQPPTGSAIDETAPPQKSPLRSALPFGQSPPPPSPTPQAQGALVPGSTGEETAPPQPSPLAAALPFRHAKEVTENVAVPAMTPDDLRRIGQGGSPAQKQAPEQDSAARAARAKLENAKTVGFMMPPGFGDTPPAPASPPPTAIVGPPVQNTISDHPAAAVRSPSIPPVPLTGGPVQAKSTGHFGLSIEQYAALCAEIAVFPAQGEAIFAKYGLASRPARLTADLAWQDRLRESVPLMERWQRLYLYYHEYFSRLGRAS